MELEEVTKKVNTRLFQIAMWWRIFYGSLRVLFGLTLIKVVGEPLLDVVVRIMQHELVEDSTDILYSFVHHILTKHPFEVTYFLASYFIFWGIIDIVLSINLLKHKLWAFPVSLYLIGVFVLYSVLRFLHTNSLVLLGVILVDIVIFMLIYREYGERTDKVIVKR